METIGERIKKIRQLKGLTQTQFAERINSVQNTVTGYENGRRNPSAPVIALICREFGINQRWLETGEGEMEVAPDNSILAALKEKYHLDADDMLLVEVFLELPQEYRAGMIEFGKKYAAKLAAQMGIELKLQNRKPDDELTKDEVLEMIGVEYDAKEEAKKRGTSTSSVSIGTSGSSKKFGRYP